MLDNVQGNSILRTPANTHTRLYHPSLFCVLSLFLAVPRAGFLFYRSTFPRRTGLTANRAPTWAIWPSTDLGRERRDQRPPGMDSTSSASRCHQDSRLRPRQQRRRPTSKRPNASTKVRLLSPGATQVDWNGSPANWTWLAEGSGRRRFYPFFFYYFLFHIFIFCIFFIFPPY